ncbi:hypothetical protein DL765_003377 [Monosporascus sp. GIB2]|nr:hypothetical protein DL765_003377 [Monosporascus sp. GIB2]
MMDFLTYFFRGKYQYPALPPGPFFRYLMLHPGQGNKALECSLRICLLDEAPDYEAISYKEKGQQVALMAKIYRRAKRTLIYLGEDKEGHGKAAVELVGEINRRIEKTCKNIDMPWTLFPYLNPEDPILSDTRWKSVAALYSSPWFGRGWVVQEAGLAQECLTIWGQHEIGWAKLMRVDVWTVWYAPSCIQTYDLGIPSLHWQSYFARHQNEARFFWKKDVPIMKLLNTLESARVLGLTDARDRIYAFLELLTSDDEEGSETGLRLHPNYEQDFLGIYQDFAMQHIRTKRKVELLDYVQHTKITLDTELPSWIPRWDLSLNAGSRLYLPFWQALTNRSSSVHNPSMAGTKLSVRAVVLDSVVYVSEVLRPLHMTLDDIAQIWKAVAQFDVATPYPPLCRLLAFVEILYGDVFEGDLQTLRRAQAAYLLDIHRKTGELEAIDSQYWKETAKGGDMNSYHTFIQTTFCGKRMFLTQRGYLGTAYAVVREGDRCGIIFGCKAPSILRNTEAENRYRLLGGAYIAGTTLLIDRERFRGFTMLGRKESKDWTEWDVEEDDILLC